ncbi:MAG: D-isomer specific 2-hydroxyacid dehydrogenase [Linnemannia elongata]|nr:MAG: D-isomer specific 2-hydroxyacid dehydrogenase [Linnemannia elongata]
MTKENILFIGTVRHAKAQEAALAAKYNIHYAAPTRKELFEQLEAAKREGITFKAIYRGFASHYTLGRVDEPLLSALPTGLELIGSVGAGYDFVDAEAATRNNQWVTNTPGVVDNATADATILLLLSTLRHQYEIEYNMRHGLPNKPRIGRDPTGMILGIVGMGGIGKAVAKRAQGLGMRVVYHNRRSISFNEGEEAYLKEVEYLPTLDALLTTSDIVSIHVPLSAETCHLIRAEQFQKMKSGAYFLNTSRGPVVDEEALVQALDSGHIAGAGLDVFEHEPKVHPELLKNMNVALMPHLGAFTIETITKMEALTMQNIDLFLSSGSLLTPVNNIPQAL